MKEQKVMKQVDVNKLLQILPCSVYWKDKNGVYLGCNEFMAKIIGLSSPTEVIGKTDYDLCWRENAEMFRKADTKVIKTGEPVSVEETGVLADGTQATYLSTKIPLVDDVTKEIIGIFGFSVDVTLQKLSEKTLYAEKLRVEAIDRAQHNMLVNLNQKITGQTLPEDTTVQEYALHMLDYLENIIGCMPGSVYWKDSNGIYRGGNDYIVKLAGFKSRKEIIGKTDYDFAKIFNWSEEMLEGVINLDKHVIATGVAVFNHEEKPFQSVDGKYINQLSNKVPLFDKKGKVIGLVGISIDITELKMLQAELLEAKNRAEAANRSKSEFLAAVSHELRIPLTSILGMARILADEHMPDYQARQIHDIIMSGEHLLALVNDLLDIAKLEAGKLELHPSPLNLRRLIEEIATMLTFQAKAKNLELHINYALDAPQMIIGDARAIRQILLNLMGNAVKFTERGYVKIKVECVSQQQLKAELLITVEDTGIGIPKEKSNSVFERFNQVDSTRTRRYGGAGLGLTITKAYVELMGGSIWVESEVGKGSNFVSQIPFPLQDMVNKPSVWDPYRAQLRVLIVDDTLRGDVIAKQLACAHFRVVAGGSEAFNVILAAQQKGEPYHIIIIDQQLQSMDAMEFGKRINMQRNLQKPMMVLLMPPSTLEARRLAKETGFFETIIKPVHPSELLVGLTAAWERWEDNNRVQNKSLSIFSGKQPNILLVEDDPIIQKVHTMMLEKVGCKVAIAQNSQEALAMYVNDYDAIFMDVGLPGMSGIEIAAEIRRREAGRGHIPIIGVTGYGYEEDKQNCLQAGMDDVAIKPLKPEELTQLLVKWVAKEQVTT